MKTFETEAELRAWLDKQNREWWQQQQATQADHERLSKDVKQAVEEAKKGKK
jgi:hypothetical protein